MKLEILEKGHYYHIYNRGINSENIFNSPDNKDYFLKLLNKYLAKKVSVHAYCLMNNHFHLVVKVEGEEKEVTQSFSNLFNAYAKAFNKQNSRTGSLFEKHFKRKRIKNEDYLINSIIYVHANPLNHGVSKDFLNYSYSSYKHYSEESTPIEFQLEKTEVIELFDSVENLIYTHKEKVGLIESGYLQGLEDLAGNSKDLAGKINSNSEEQNNDGSKKFNVKDKFYNYIQNLQNTITSKLEAVDGKAKFKEDLWERPEGGGGRTRVIENGKVFEKGGVNISAVHGELPKTMQQHFGVEEANFFACGLSLVLHPKNPFVPTVHANWRYFEMYNKQGEIVDAWFGGGQDLTPYYLFDEDAKHFHQVCKTACDHHNLEFYPKYKERCDEYFYNTHRKEGRGLGGLFFDYCKKTDLSSESLEKGDEMSMQNWYDFVTEVGDSFLEAYTPIVEKRKELPYTEAQRNWQEIRRGRYVEFNLVHDKGTLFGLKTNGRIESILMSLPPHVQWVYNHTPEVGSEEEKLLKVLANPKDWV